MAAALNSRTPMRSIGYGEGLSQQTDSRRVPLTRRYAPTSPRKRGEVRKNHTARFSASARSVLSQETPPSFSGDVTQPVQCLVSQASWLRE